MDLSKTKENGALTSYQALNPESAGANRTLQIEDGNDARTALESTTGAEDSNLPQPGSVGGIRIEYTHPSSLSDSFKGYITSPYLVAELAVCTFYVGIGHFAPDKIFQLELHERDIPYQMTANGDIILDQYINRPLTENETIPDWLLIVLTFFLPFLIIAVAGVTSLVKNDLHSGVCSLFFAIGSTEFITSFVKLYAGYFRPNFYSYCDFSEDTFTCNSDSPTPRKSFPSGHASIAFCSMTLLTLFFYGNIGLHRRLSPLCPREQRSAADYCKKRILSVIAALPMFLAVFIAASRVHDDMHHPADVVGGAVIGISCALFGYGLW